MALKRRAQILPQQPAAANLAAGARRRDQGPLGLRAGTPAAEAGTRFRLLRGPVLDRPAPARPDDLHGLDRKSTRLNSSHANISDAVFCMKKKMDIQGIGDGN